MAEKICLAFTYSINEWYLLVTLLHFPFFAYKVRSILIKTSFLLNPIKTHSLHFVAVLKLSRSRNYMGLIELLMSLFIVWTEMHLFFSTDFIL